MPTIPELRAQIKPLCEELDKRVKRHRKLEPYFECRDPLRVPIPEAISKSKLVNAYRSLMGMSETPWGKVVVNSKLDRLEVTGVQSGAKAADDAVWGLWQDNAMDLESKLGHAAALLDGRAHGMVWPDKAGVPRFSLDDVTQTVVQFEEGSRRDRVAALRRWVDFDQREHVTLYRPDGIYKFSRKQPQDNGPTWVRREVDGEPWPLPNPYNVVPVVELAVNRRLKAGVFTHCRGEFEDVTGLMDRINLLTFLGLVVAIWMGFPLRGVVGAEILNKDDEGNPLPPFESRPDSVVQFENPEAKLVEFKAADRSNLSMFPELTELASATSTPRHYFPMDSGISNVSEPTIRAFEGGMHATINASHKPSLGEGWEELLRTGGRMLPDPVELSPRAALQWADHESRSLGERADAALKLNQAGLPWQAVAALALNLGQDQIRQYETQYAGSAITDLLRAARDPAPSNGNGNGNVPVAA